MLYENIKDEFITPSRLIGNLYFVGIHHASTHIIDTGEGLILIDPGYEETFHIVLNNIWKVGLNPEDIKYIVLTHGHLDHTGATNRLLEITDATTFLGKYDLEKVQSYMTPDVLLEDGDVITLGNTSMRFVHTPGHTPGTMSLFFNITDGEKTYKAGMFGGAGHNTLVKAYLEKYNISRDVRNTFRESILKIRDEDVEVFVGNHVGNNNTEGKIAMLGSSAENPFIDPAEWKKFLDSRIAKVDEIIKNDE